MVAQAPKGAGPKSEHVTTDEADGNATHVFLQSAHPNHARGPATTLPPDLGYTRANILLVDDEPVVLRSVARELRALGYHVSTVDNGREAVNRVDAASFDVILTDITMPDMTGIELLRKVREHDVHVPVVLITGSPAVDTAVQALEFGAFHYLTKPLDRRVMRRVIDKAVQKRRIARVKQQTARVLGDATEPENDVDLGAALRSAMQSLWLAFQPIVDVRQRKTFGHEALLRSDEPKLPHPGAVLDAARRLGCLDVLGRAIREKAAATVSGAPEAGVLFVNLHVTDLLDPTLASPQSPLSHMASRVVLEITERASLDLVKGVGARVAALREMGFRIAVDDLGAGYAGLTSFALLEPEFVKLDMSLIRDVDTSVTKQKLIRSMVTLAQDMGLLVVAEGVETPGERATLEALGCDLLQGYLFARPQRKFPEVVW